MAQVKATLRCSEIKGKRKLICGKVISGMSSVKSWTTPVTIPRMLVLSKPQKCIQVMSTSQLTNMTIFLTSNLEMELCANFLLITGQTNKMQLLNSAKENKLIG